MAVKVWVYPERSWELLGAERWQVSWEQVKKSAEARLAACNDIDPDSDIDFLVINCLAKEPAIKRARKILDSGVTAFGAVNVTRQVVDWFVEEDRIAEWVNTLDSEEVSG